MNKTVLKIFTLNVWGLKFVSLHRKERIKLIAHHLSQHDYDVVFLQEVWVQSDFEYIRTTTQSKYKFAHMFKNASILGTSGLVVLVKWIPKVFHFHPFSVNGSPFRPLHGDWFTSKGIGYVRVELDAFNLHLFCTHMHAQYNLEERLNDQYSVHRICQSYEMAKFIELVTKSSNEKDFVILAGDMNASSKEFPYRLLVGLTQLNDCYYYYRNNTIKMNDGLESGDYVHRSEFDSDLTDDEYHTCGHRDNTYKAAAEPSKRIDFILFRLFDKIESSAKKKSLCKVEHLTIVCKDESGMSFSDHQPVVALFKLKCFDMNNEIKKCESSEEENKEECNKNIDTEEQSVFISSGNKRRNCVKRHSVGDGSDSCDKLHESSGDGCGQSNRQGLLSAKLKSNVLPEVDSNDVKKSKNGHLKHTRKSKPTRKQLLEETKAVLEEYVIENRWSLKYFTILLIFVMTLMSLLISTLLMWAQMSKFSTFVSILVLTIVTLFMAFLKFLSSRTEKNAIKAILNEIEKDIERDPLLNFSNVGTKQVIPIS